MQYGYDKNIDYTAAMKEAIGAGDFRRAAILEAQRNAKVQGENMGPDYKITNDYAAWLPHQDQINSGMDRLAEEKSWSYDAAKDPAWQAARKQYLREADRGTRDAMAAAAGMTGGVPSTAAVAAGQQTGNYYRAQLADRLPEYMQADYNRWANNREMDRADLQTLAALDNQQNEYSLTLQQMQAQQQQQAIQNAMQRWETLGYADQSVANALGVPVGTSTQSAAYQQWAQNFQQQQDAWDREYQQWQQHQSEQNTAYSHVMTWLQMGLMPSDEELAAAGISREQAQQYIEHVQQQYVSHYGGGSYSGGSGSGDVGNGGDGNTGGGGGGNTYTNEEIQNAYNQVKTAIGIALQSGNINYALQALDKYSGYLTPEMANEIKALMNKYFPGQTSGGNAEVGARWKPGQPYDMTQ